MGMAFGESILMGGNGKNRFYNAYAMTECVFLSLAKADFDYVVNSSERKIFNEKWTFLKSIPEFSALQLPRSKLVYLCENLISLQCIKHTTLFNQGDPSNYLYLVKSGEFQVTKKLHIKGIEQEITDY
jgi:CRP-like cAMP-binding protein